MALVNVRRPSSLHGNEEITCPESLYSRSSSWVAGIDINESYFTVKGAAVILSHSQQSLCPTNSQNECLHEIELHLQSMLSILRPQDTLSMAVRLQNNNPNHSRYLAIITSTENKRESALIGFDYFLDNISIGLNPIPLLASTNIELDGDGGILVEFASTFYIFKPVSIQAMWLVFQNLHKELRRISIPFKGIPQYNWIFYQDPSFSTSDDALCSLWQTSLIDEAARDDLKASVIYTETRTIAEIEEEAIISGKLRQIMQNEVTSRDIRKRLEDECGVCMPDYKDFIDRTMLYILGQMEKPSKIFDYLYLGSEWNSANFQELERNNVKYILNVSKEVDNFFPAHFEYMKIFVSDEASTNLIGIWQRTFNFIKTAKENNSVLLVHCKKGISRSASTVIAFIMKEYGWTLEQALNYVKEKRNCITPNSGFMDQLVTFSGMLTASSNRRSAVFLRSSPPTV